MPEPKLPLTSTVTIGHPLHTDVRVAEVRRPQPGVEADTCYIEIARGNIAVQLTGTLRQLQLIAVAVTDGLVKIGEARGMEGR